MQKLFKRLLSEGRHEHLNWSERLSMIGQEAGVKDISLPRTQCLKKHGGMKKIHLTLDSKCNSLTIIHYSFSVIEWGVSREGKKSERWGTQRRENRVAGC